MLKKEFHYIAVDLGVCHEPEVATDDWMELDTEQMEKDAMTRLSAEDKMDEFNS